MAGSFPKAAVDGQEANDVGEAAATPQVGEDVGAFAAGGPRVVFHDLEVGDDEMELGVGIHGEPGRRRVKMMAADNVAAVMVDAIVPDLPLAAGKAALLLVNGFGGTPAMELYLMYNSARRLLEAHGFSVIRSLVGSYVTSLDMAGCSQIVSLLNDESARLWDAPVRTPALRQGL